MSKRRSILFASTCLALVAALLLGAAGASAKRTLGWTPATTPLSAPCNESPFDFAQFEVADPLVTYTVPRSGQILSWSTRAYFTEHQQLTFKVFRPIGIQEYTVVAADPRSLEPSVLNTFAVSIPVRAGDMIGLQATGAGLHHTACRVVTGAAGDIVGFEEGDAAVGESLEIFTENEGERLNVSAVLLAAPTITALGATSGPPAGGTAVAIAGTEFAEVKEVAFGSTAATFTIDSEGQITATAPGGPVGEVPVTVTTSIGSATAAQKFTYAVPASPAPPTPSPPAPAPAKLSIAKPKPLTLKVGKWRTVKVKVTNTGGTPSALGTLTIKPQKGVVVKPAKQKLPVLPPGGAWTLSLKVQLTEAAKETSTLRLAVSAAGTSATGSLALRPARP